MAPLSWIRRIYSELPEMQIIPLFGNAPAFDWHHFSSSLASRFGLAHLQIRSKEQTWRVGSEVKKGLGMNLLTLPIAIAPLGNVFWLMAQEDVAKLTSWLMNPTNKERTLSSEILQEGFYRYLGLEAMNLLQKMDPFLDLTLQMSEEEGSWEKTFCIDIEIRLENHSCWGRLIIPAQLRTAWVQHFSQMPSDYVPTEIAQQTELVLGVKIGSVLLHQNEWKTINVGDFLVLDRGGYDVHQKSSVAMLMLQSTPLFNVKIKSNQIELIDYAFYYEDTTMEEQKGEPQEDDSMEQPFEDESPSEEGEIVALKELPLYVTVEIARLKITLDQLMHLNPGNVLELPIHPDQGVFLTIQGQKVARAELVYLGEQLGVRILEI